MHGGISNGRRVIPNIRWLGYPLNYELAWQYWRFRFADRSSHAAREFLSIMEPDAAQVSIQEIALMVSRIFSVPTLFLSKSAGFRFIQATGRKKLGRYATGSFRVVIKYPVAKKQLHWITPDANRNTGSYSLVCIGTRCRTGSSTGGRLSIT